MISYLSVRPVVLTPINFDSTSADSILTSQGYEVDTHLFNLHDNICAIENQSVVSAAF
jgi:hypothetical protein